MLFFPVSYLPFDFGKVSPAKTKVKGENMTVKPHFNSVKLQGMFLSITLTKKRSATIDQYLQEIKRLMGATFAMRRKSKVDYVSQVRGKQCSLSEVLYRLDWIEILREAVEMRRSSWGNRPVVEWRNASDEVCLAVRRALDAAGVDLYLTRVVWKKQTVQP